AAPAVQPSYTVEHVKRDLALTDAVVRIRIDNPHGSVAVRQVDRPVVGTYEVIQRIGERPEEPQVALSLDGDTAVLTVAYASDRAGGADRRVDGHRKGRVDLGVFVPKGPRVEIATTYGDVIVRRIANDVVVRTRDGRLTAAGSGAMDLATVSGELRAYPTSAKWTTPMRLATDSGNVLLEVPVSGPVALAARTRGAFTGPFKLAPTMLTDGRSEVRWTGGSGTQHIDIDSASGDIHLIGHR
ncbi:MAG TPA: DUF4097 family beta strand repeat-containing protein, partial [Tahibacter sp.]|nr:DUF4097 family beta strand repeat-containing protein [Tahibacter sp.]